MHPNPAFRAEDRARGLALARDRAFGTLAVDGSGGPDGPLLSHVPFLLAGDGASADLHLVRSNPIARHADGPAVLAVTGPDAYLSPDWYGVRDQVPTWNDVAVHLRGRLERLPDAAMRDMLDRQSADREVRLAPKAPWRADEMTPEALERMMRQIVPFRLHVAEVASTWKLSQNKPDAVRLAASDALAERGDAAEMAGLMAVVGLTDG